MTDLTFEVSNPIHNVLSTLKTPDFLGLFLVPKLCLGMPANSVSRSQTLFGNACPDALHRIIFTKAKKCQHQ